MTLFTDVDDEWDDAVHPLDSPALDLGFLFSEIEIDQVVMNRRAAVRAQRIAATLSMVRERPWIYVALPEPVAADDVVRAVLLELSSRLRLTEPALRDLAHVADSAREHLPRLWALALEGRATLGQVRFAVSRLPELLSDHGADDSAQDAAAEAIAAFDAALADVAAVTTAEAFRRRARALAVRLGTRPAEVRHAEALAERRVIVEPSDDGMAWIHALVPLVDAIGIKRRLTATAKHLQRSERRGRTRDQVRADLLSAWLRGVGTPTPVKTKVFVTVPVSLLTRAARATVRRNTGGRVGIDLGAEPQLAGHGPIDPLTAAQLFFDAPAFRRVITDPVRGVVLDMDRRTYRPTKAQRDWLVLTRGTCARDGCSRLALDADLDHRLAWADRGRTDVGNLDPYCAADHTSKHAGIIRYRPREDGSVQLLTPTGYASTADPPF